MILKASVYALFSIHKQNKRSKTHKGKAVVKGRKMPIVTWVMLKKDNQMYKYTLYDNTHLFHPELMNIQIEGWNQDVELTYDDIFCIRTEDYCSAVRRIEQIPTSMSELYIKMSNITEAPVFPPDIKNIQLYGTDIELTEEQRTELHRLYPKALIAIDSSPFLKKKAIPIPVRREVYIRTNYDDYDSDANSQYSSYFDRGEEEEEDDDNDGLYNGFDMNHVLNTDETVHLTSINYSVLQSIQVIQEESQKYPEVLKPIHLLFEEERSQRRSFSNKLWSETEEFEDEDNRTLRTALREWCEQLQKVHGVTFQELFRMVMTIIDGQPEEETQQNMKQRVMEELRDAIDKCFMGRINRLVSSLVGFVEGIHVGVSVKEEIQMKILLIVQNITHKKINGRQAREQMLNLFENVGMEDGITEYYKQVNLSALDDLVGDDM